MRKKISLGLESIQFQDGRFFKELTAWFEAALEGRDKKSESALKKHVESKVDALTKTIKTFTGLTVDFHVDDFGPCVMVPDISKNHVLYNDLMRLVHSGDETFKKLKAGGGVIKGGVSLREGKVTGWYSDIVSDMYFPLSMFMEWSGFTTSELAAILLHEIGHPFGAFEYLSKQVKTNVVLSVLSKKWVNADIKDREVIVRDAKQILNLSDEDIDAAALATVSDTTIVETIFVTAAYRDINSEIDGIEYDGVSFEYIADEFAARHGAGKDIVTGLDKLYRLFGDTAYRGMGMYIALEIAKFSLLFINPVLAGFLAIITMDTGGSPYDVPMDRYRRMKNQLVERIKLKSIPPAERKQLIEDIAVIDGILETVNDRRQLLTLAVEVALPFTKLSKKRKQLELQRELEQLAFNNLYVKSAALTAISQEK